MSGDSSNPRQSAWIVIAMRAVIAVPAALTLSTVRSPSKLQVLNPDPSPHGYTGSLLLFIVPIAVIAFWFLPAEEVRIPRRAFWRTIAVLVPLGCILDLVFARWFFFFPNRSATPAASFFPTARPFFKLACLGPDTVLDRPGEPSLGSNPRHSLRMVGLPAKADDRTVHRRLVWAADRGGMRLDSNNVCHSNCLRGRQAVPGLGQNRAGRVSCIQEIRADRTPTGSRCTAMSECFCVAFYGKGSARCQELEYGS